MISILQSKCQKPVLNLEMLIELLAELNILQLQEQLTLFHHQKTLEQELNNRNKEVFALHPTQRSEYF